jgi:hypothetical protein
MICTFNSDVNQFDVAFLSALHALLPSLKTEKTSCKIEKAFNQPN